MRESRYREMALIAANVLIGNRISAGKKFLKDWKWIVAGIGSALFLLILLISLLVSLPGIMMQSMLQQDKEDPFKELSIFAQEEVKEAEEEKKGFLQELLASLKGDDDSEPTLQGDVDNQQVMILYAAKYGEYMSKDKLNKKHIRELTRAFIEIDGLSVRIKPFEQVVTEVGLTDEQEAIALTMYQYYTGTFFMAGSGGSGAGGEYSDDEPFVGTGGNGELIFPVGNYRVTSKFGPRVHPVTHQVNSVHTGVDLAVPTGTKVRAAYDGKVITSKYSGSYGNLVVIDHGVVNGNRIVTYYAHNSVLPVSVGTTVKQGQIVALSGSTGRSTGPHVHFEVRVNGKPQNPFSWAK